VSAWNIDGFLAMRDCGVLAVQLINTHAAATRSDRSMGVVIDMAHISTGWGAAPVPIHRAA
jgi:hypothetical protein